MKIIRHHDAAGNRHTCKGKCNYHLGDAEPICSLCNEALADAVWSTAHITFCVCRKCAINDLAQLIGDACGESPRVQGDFAVISGNFWRSVAISATTSDVMTHHALYPDEPLKPVA